MITTNGVAHHVAHGESSDDTRNAGPGSASGGTNEPKLAEQLVRLVELQADLFHDPRDVPHATVNITGTDGRSIAHTLRLDSPRFRRWIARAARVANGQTAASSVIAEALIALEAIACFDRPMASVHVRVAEHNGAIYADLADDTGQFIAVTAAGWQIVDRAPVRFVRPNGVEPLVRPARGGTIELLRPLVNVDADGFTMLVAWLVACWWPNHPCPALAIAGEQGAAKTTTSKLARRLIDPNVADLRAPPRNEDDLLIAACSSRVFALDNLSGIPPWLSDALCRLITGGGFSKRKLYSDEDETILEAIRPVMLNGIEDVADRPDLAERCIALTLRPIPEANRRDEDAYWRDFDAVAPRLLGVLLDGVASALARIGEVHLATLPRMADFAKWTAAAEPGLGLASGSIAAAYARNQALVVATALDASPVATALRALLRSSGGTWAGTPTALLDAVTAFVPVEAQFSRAWPKTASQLTGQLRRAATALRQTGIDVDATHQGRDRVKKRWLAIRVTPIANRDATAPERTNREDP